MPDPLQPKFDELRREIRDIQSQLARLPARWGGGVMRGPRLGVVVCSGPEGQGDFQDNRYWVAAARITNAHTDPADAKVAIAAYGSGDPRREIWAVTNLFEDNCGTHNVRPQTPVLVFDELAEPNNPGDEPAVRRRWMVVADEGICRAEPCEPSGSSSSSSESSSGSSSSSSSGELRCVYRWNCQYDCETQQWGPVTFVGSNCMAPPDQVGQWIPTATPCLYTYWGVGDPCDVPEDPDCGGEPPPSPPAPDFAPDCCGSSVSSEPSQPSGSEKSSAIVPASWSAGGYAALYVEEAPQVRFNDVITVALRPRDTTLILDSKFVEVCEPNSIEVIGWSSDRPMRLGLRVIGSRLHVQFPQWRRWIGWRGRPVRLVVRLSGIRKGFAGVRFGDRTRAEFEANERFLGMARPMQ